MSIDRPKLLMRWAATKKAMQDFDLSPAARAAAKKVRDSAFLALLLDSARNRTTRH